MAENDSATGPHRAANTKRLEDARRKGQVPRSRELSMMAVTLVGGAALYCSAGQITAPDGVD